MFKPNSAEHSRSTFCSRAFESQHDPTTHNEPQDTTAPTTEQTFHNTESAEDTEKIIRHNIIDSDRSSAAWGFRQHGNLDARRQPK